jgi:hypothetical protein
MRRRRYGFGLVVLGCLVLGAFATDTMAGTPTRTRDFVLHEHGPYGCVGPCAAATYFYAHGVARSDTVFLHKVATSAVGQVLGYNPATNCLDQKEHWALTLPNTGQDTIFMDTTVDRLCFTADPNVSHEHARFVITGGTGRFADATGGGRIRLRVLTSPQVGSGRIIGHVTY